MAAPDTMQREFKKNSPIERRDDEYVKKASRGLKIKIITLLLLLYYLLLGCFQEYWVILLSFFVLPLFLFFCSSSILFHLRPRAFILCIMCCKIRDVIGFG